MRRIRIRKRKNVSQTVLNGRTLQTRDEFLESGKNYIKPGYEKKGLYRKVVVVDSNRNDELAVIKLTTKGKHKLPSYQKGKSSYNAFIETKDNKNMPIKVGIKFRLNNRSNDIAKSDINNMKKNSLIKASRNTKQSNRKQLRKLKSR